MGKRHPTGVEKLTPIKWMSWGVRAILSKSTKPVRALFAELIHDDAPPGNDKVGVFQKLEVFERIASHGDNVRRGAGAQRSKWRHSKFYSCFGGRRLDHIERRHSRDMMHQLQFLGVDSPRHVRMRNFRAVEKMGACVRQDCGVGENAESNATSCRAS